MRFFLVLVLALASSALPRSARAGLYEEFGAGKRMYCADAADSSQKQVSAIFYRGSGQYRGRELFYWEFSVFGEKAGQLGWGTVITESFGEQSPSGRWGFSFGNRGGKLSMAPAKGGGLILYIEHYQGLHATLTHCRVF
jgi:hypothetical protein